MAEQVKFERNPRTGELQAPPKKSKRQLRREAEEGLPRMIVMPRRGPRGLTKAEIEEGLAASTEAKHPTYMKWSIE